MITEKVICQPGDLFVCGVDWSYRMEDSKETWIMMIIGNYPGTTQIIYQVMIMT